MSLHTWLHQGPCKPSSCATFTLNPHWGRAATGKKILGSMRTGSLQSCPTLCNPVDCGLPDFSFREGLLQARLLEWTGQYGLPYPSRALYFLLPSLSASLSTWCCQNLCDPTSCTTSTSGPHRGKPKPSGKPQELNPNGQLTCRGGNKTTIETWGSVAKEEDPKPSHWLYKLKIKSTWSTKQTLCQWNIWKAIESSHKRKRTSSDSCGHWRQEHTDVGPD